MDTAVEPLDNSSVDRVMRVLRDTLRIEVAETGLPAGRKLHEVAAMDSMTVLEYVAGLEKEFGVEVEPDLLRLDFLSDVPQVAAYLERRAQSKAS